MNVPNRALEREPAEYLIVHIGLHKTGSTFLQAICNGHNELLKKNGVYYKPQHGYPAHHHDAWRLLRGSAQTIIPHVNEANAHGCKFVLISSEDLEALLFEPDLQKSVELTAIDAGIRFLEWHLTIREPGPVFASLYSEQVKHHYVDPFVMFYEVMKRGYISIVDPHHGREGTPFWHFCFDHWRFLSEFQNRTAGRIVVHDFSDQNPFPGWTLLKRLGIPTRDLTGAQRWRNRRLEWTEVEGLQREAILKLVEGSPLLGDLRTILERRIKSSSEALDVLSSIIQQRFAESKARATCRWSVKRFAPVMG